jgi:methylated-DNA-[protein]-cysteine S-methyltransferase
MHAAENILHSGPPPEVMPIHWAGLATPLGPIHVAAAPDGVVAVSTAARADEAFVAWLDEELGPRTRLVQGASPVLDAALDELAAYFAGRLQRFTVPLDWRLLHGDFNHRVLTALQAVAWGHLISYSELARRVGAPRAARAVGRACGANPLPILVPCHRVVHADGGIGGYGGAGIAYKRALLAIEHVTFPVER